MGVRPAMKGAIIRPRNPRGFHCRFYFFLLVSVATLWLTLLRRGAVKMTLPTVIYFGPDGAPSPHPKVFLRSLLFCTSGRGRIIESMHIALSRNETHQNFSVWVYGNDKLVRGSGLFVGETGVEANQIGRAH